MNSVGQLWIQLGRFGVEYFPLDLNVTDIPLKIILKSQSLRYVHTFFTEAGRRPQIEEVAPQASVHLGFTLSGGLNSLAATACSANLLGAVSQADAVGEVSVVAPPPFQ